MLGLLQQASDAIVGRAGPDRKLLLVVNDAQFLDEGSAALVHQLVQKGACSVVASLRTPGPAPDPVTALWKDGLAERIDLGTWGEAETEAVLSTFLGGPVASSSVRRLWELSRGNALYLRELLIGAVDSGALAENSGIWALRLPLTAPGRLVELVASRLSGLAPSTVAVIELLAVGEPLGVPLLEKIAEPAALEDAEAQGLVQVHQDGRRMVARLAHPVYGEALRQSLPRSRLRRISAILAEAIEATGARRREDLLRLGRLQLDSGVASEPALLTRAAQRAGEVFDMELAAARPGVPGPRWRGRRGPGPWRSQVRVRAARRGRDRARGHGPAVPDRRRAGPDRQRPGAQPAQPAGRPGRRHRGP